MEYDITFHPGWWHKNYGICFGGEFWLDPRVRIGADIKMRRALYERFGRYGLGEKTPAERPLVGTRYLAAGFCIRRFWAVM